MARKTELFWFKWFYKKKKKIIDKLRLMIVINLYNE